MPEFVLETARLRLRQVSTDDAGFMLGLTNEPSWLQFIGDKGIRTLADARAYIERSYLAMYARCGHGLYLVELKPGNTAIGICGLIRRDGLADVDLGYAFLPAHWNQGYAHEAASAVIDYGKTRFGLTRLIALTALDNERSARLLEKLGFRFEKTGRLTRDGAESKLFAREL
jgi:RimJ/RimL family protein N-acetyltransferase